MTNDQKIAQLKADYIDFLCGCLETGEVEPAALSLIDKLLARENPLDPSAREATDASIFAALQEAKKHERRLPPVDTESSDPATR